MKENLFTRLFGRGEKKTAEMRSETRKSSTPNSESPDKALSADEIKRNADFWNAAHRNMGDALFAAANTLLAAAQGQLSDGERCDLLLYRKAVSFAKLIVGTNGEMERVKKKYHTDDLFQIFRNVTMEDLL